MIIELHDTDLNTFLYLTRKSDYSRTALVSIFNYLEGNDIIIDLDDILSSKYFVEFENVEELGFKNEAELRDAFIVLNNNVAVVKDV